MEKFKTISSIKPAISVSLLIFLLFAITSCSSEIVEPAPRVYISLGDSVSSGFGLVGYRVGDDTARPHNRHTTIFYDLLANTGHIDMYKNKATSGYTTTMLLDMLRSADEETLSYFYNAEIITLNIGGNNILSPFLLYLSNLEAVAGGNNLRVGAETLAEAWGVIAHFMPNVEESDDDTTNELGIMDIVSGIRDIVSGLGDLITGGREVVSGIPSVVSILLGSLSSELEQDLEIGVQAFEVEFTQIISWLNIHAPNATIVVNTVYNPIPCEIGGVTIPLSNTANTLIERMNHKIYVESDTHGFLVVDIYSYFKNRMDLIFFNLNPLSDAISFDIIHPNDAGHALIAQLHYEYFMASR